MNVAKICLLFTVALYLQNCGTADRDRATGETEREQPQAATYANEAERIVRQSVEAGNLATLDSANYVFRFRDKEYGYEKANGRFKYERWWQDADSDDAIRDVLTNDGFTRYVNDQPVELTEKKTMAYTESVNSVIYFAFMPYALLDPAANLTDLGKQQIKGETFDAIGVDFAEDGGGKDFDDSFRYWFEPATHKLRYLAYVEAGNKEPRFREAYNERTEGGITVRDYRNYHPGKDVRLAVDSLAPRFSRGELLLLSDIALENVRRR